MASLQQIGSTFHVRFRFGGMAFRRSLETSYKDEAETARKQVEVTLHRIKTGVLPPPSAGADVAFYVISGGKINQPLVLPEEPPPLTLRGLWDGYRERLPPGSKDSRTKEILVPVVAGTFPSWCKDKLKHVVRLESSLPPDGHAVDKWRCFRRYVERDGQRQLYHSDFHAHETLENVVIGAVDLHPS
jgi:hypothetical protein